MTRRVNRGAVPTAQRADFIPHQRKGCRLIVIDSVLAIPGVGESIKPMVDELRSKLTTLASV